MIQITLDERSLAVLNHISESVSVWDELIYRKTANELAELAKEYMKPLMHVRPSYTGSAEDNLNHTVSYDGYGFEINFSSNFYANFVDEGSPFSKLFASAYGLKAFPIKLGEGGVMLSGSISGVGQGNSPYASQLPTHFSQRTADYLQDKAAEIALANMNQWINQAVM